MAQYTLCPFYLETYKASITCEDAHRVFESSDDKRSYMAAYCDANWSECIYAKALNKAYEEGDEAVEKLKEKSKMDELRSLTTKLGRAKKRIGELEAIGKSYTNEITQLKKQKRDYYNRWKKAKAELDKRNDDLMAEINKLTQIYEQRMCYLIDQFAPDGKLVEDDAEAWAEGKEFALVHDANEDAGLYWKVMFREEGDTDDAHEPGRIQRTDESAGEAAEE